MNTEEAFCPNPECPLHGLQDQDNRTATKTAVFSRAA